MRLARDRIEAWLLAALVATLLGQAVLAVLAGTAVVAQLR